MTTGILSLSDSCLYLPYPGNEAASVLENTTAQGVFGSNAKCEGSQLHSLQTDVAKVGICVLCMQANSVPNKNTRFWKKIKTFSKGSSRSSPNFWHRYEFLNNKSIVCLFVIYLFVVYLFVVYLFVVY